MHLLVTSKETYKQQKETNKHLSIKGSIEGCISHPMHPLMDLVRLKPFFFPLQHTATHCNTLQHTATHCNTHPMHPLMGFSAPCASEHTATQCNVLQHTTAYCSTLQHTATYCYTL